MPDHLRRLSHRIALATCLLAGLLPMMPNAIAADPTSADVNPVDLPTIAGFVPVGAWLQTWAHDRPEQLQGVLGRAQEAFADGALRVAGRPVASAKRDGERGVLLIGSAGTSIDVPVERRADRLWVVHAALAGEGIRQWRVAAALLKRQGELPPPPRTMAVYEIRYADGESLPIRIRWGESVDGIRQLQEPRPLLWSTAEVVGPADHPSGELACVQLMAIDNPRPDVQIESIRLRSPDRFWEANGEVAVLGIATEAVERTGRLLYVAPAPYGDDTGDGGYKHPWASFAHAAAAAKPGDTVYIREGLYALSEQVRLTQSGRPDAWTTFSAFPGEDATFDGLTHLENPAEMPGAIEPPYFHDFGIIQFTEAAKHVRLQGITLLHSRRSGIHSFRSNEIEVLHNRVCRTYASGLRIVYTHGARIVGNLVAQPNTSIMHMDRQGKPLPRMHSPHEGLTVSGGERAEVAYNEVYAGEKEGIDFKGNPRNGRIHHNYVHNVASGGIYMDSWAPTLQGLEVYANTLHESGGIVVGTENHTPVADIHIHHNVIYDSWAQGVVVWASRTSARRIRVDHNTIARCGFRNTRVSGWDGGGIYVQVSDADPMEDVTIEDNITARNSGFEIALDVPLGSQKAVTIGRNLVDPLPGQTLNKPERHHPVIGGELLRSDPHFVDPEAGDFRLRDGSPAIGTAADGGDMGALPFGLAPDPGIAMGGQVMTRYHDGWDYAPLSIPQHLFNAHRTQNSDTPWFRPRFWNYSFITLPAGWRSLGGIEWRIPEAYASIPHVIMLAGDDSSTDARTVGPVPVGRKADALCFLHTYSPSWKLKAWWRATPPADQAPVVFRYHVVYADGTELDVPVRFGRDIGGWLRFGDWPSPPDARVAWAEPVNLTGNRQGWRQGWREDDEAGYTVAYAMRWVNPRPEVAIHAVQVVRGDDVTDDMGSAAILAVTVADRVRQPAP